MAEHSILSTRLDGRRLALALVLLTVAGTGCWVETDRSLYTAGDPGTATLTNRLNVPLSLAGCAPFVFERSLDGDWLDLGPPYLCFWEGIALSVNPKESVETAFDAPADSGRYRLRFDAAAICEPGLPLSQAKCAIPDLALYSAPFEVERELCDGSEEGCRFVPAAPNFLCEDGEHIAGPASECTRDPSTQQCGYEFLDCP